MTNVSDLTLDGVVTNVYRSPRVADTYSTDGPASGSPQTITAGSGWIALTGFGGDCQVSLSLTPRSDGIVYVNCWASCSVYGTATAGSSPVDFGIRMTEPDSATTILDLGKVGRGQGGTEHLTLTGACKHYSSKGAGTYVFRCMLQATTTNASFDSNDYCSLAVWEA